MDKCCILYRRDISTRMPIAWYHNSRTFLPSRMTDPRVDGCGYMNIYFNIF